MLILKIAFKNIGVETTEQCNHQSITSILQMLVILSNMIQLQEQNKDRLEEAEDTQRHMGNLKQNGIVEFEIYILIYSYLKIVNLF